VRSNPKYRTLFTALCCGLLFLAFLPMQAQYNGPFGDETELYAETKQLNQFFRRFNGEEDLRGERLYAGDPGYRDAARRRDFVEILFDQQSGDYAEIDQIRFVDQVCNTQDPQFLSFHGGQWFAEVETKFNYQGRPEEVILYMQLEADGLGHKWVIRSAWWEGYAQLFNLESAPEGSIPFLHPLSHELDFMNLAKVFRDHEDLQPFTAENFEPDHLTLLVLDIAQGKMEFEAVRDLRFHFYQIDGWYFELQDKQRSGLNTGWLITELHPMGSEISGKPGAPAGLDKSYFKRP
jgi:hypothetical protein